MSPTLIVIGLVAFIALFIFYLYNSLVTAKMRVREAWSGIDVQLKRRSSLIPNLLETVKGYAKHEKSVFTEVTKARTALMAAKSPKAAAGAENMLSGALKTLFALSENYPALRASENFKELQEELSDTETKIAAARQFYNANVLDYNTKIKIFPNAILANMMGFSQEEFFEAEAPSKEEIKVKFES